MAEHLGDLTEALFTWAQRRSVVDDHALLATARMRVVIDVGWTLDDRTELVERASSSFEPCISHDQPPC